MLYLDHAATTPLRPEVRAAMEPWLGEGFGNPSSVYRQGREARRALDDARDTVARVLGAESREVFFTSGGSEALNWALKGAAWARAGRGNHIVSTRIEHHAVLGALAFLETQGFEVRYLSPGSDGIVHPDAVEEALTPRTILVSVMHANNEVGTIQPVAEIARRVRARGILFCTDAVQTAGILPLDVNVLGCDLLALSAHKFYGPKGSGALYVRRGTPLVPLVHGGGQERTLRGGTENVAGAVGLAQALELARAEAPALGRRLATLRDRLQEQILAGVNGALVTGDPVRRLPGHLHLCFEGIDGESLLLNLDLAGVAASSGSACTSGSLEPSHVLLAMGIPRALASGSLRLTLGRSTTEADVNRAAATVAEVCRRLRARQPAYEEAGT